MFDDLSKKRSLGCIFILIVGGSLSGDILLMSQFCLL